MSTFRAICTIPASFRESRAACCIPLRPFSPFLPLLLLAVFFSSCQSRVGEPTTSLTIHICEEATVSESVYPLLLTVSTETGVTRHDERITSPGSTSYMTLPAWARYHIVVRSAAGYSAFCEYLLRDQPATLVLMLSADPVPSTGDTIHINLDDTNNPPASSEDSLLTPDVIRIDALPSACSLWRDHLVAFIDSLSPNVTELTLLSLYDWSNVASANHVDRSQEAAIMAQGYTELDLSDWRIPSTDQAKRLRDTYGSNLPAFEQLNALLRSIEASEIQLQTGNDNARYLCDDGLKSFSFVSGTTISSAGTKATNYRLRLLRTLRVTTKK